MKTLFSLGGIMAILGLAVATTFAQTQSATNSSTTYIQTSKLVGKKVKSSQGDEIGVVKDVVLDGNGCMAYTVLSTGGRGGTQVSGGGKMVAVPWTVYSSPTPDLSELTVTVDRERIYNAPVFDYARIEEYSRPDYINNVYSYYGVSGGGAVGVGVSGGTSTTTTGATTTTGTATGANTAAGAATSSAAGASAEGSPVPNATEAGRRAHPGAAAAAGAAAVRARETAAPTPYGRAGTSPSKERTPSAKQKQQQTTPSSRGKTQTQSETVRAPSEGATTGEKTKGSTRERSRSREATTPSERPQG